jgi:hypothetical protein
LGGSQRKVIDLELKALCFLLIEVLIVDFVNQTGRVAVHNAEYDYDDRNTDYASPGTVSHKSSSRRADLLVDLVLRQIMLTGNSLLGMVDAPAVRASGETLQKTLQEAPGGVAFDNLGRVVDGSRDRHEIVIFRIDQDIGGDVTAHLVGDLVVAFGFQQSDQSGDCRACHRFLREVQTVCESQLPIAKVWLFPTTIMELISSARG